MDITFDVTFAPYCVARREHLLRGFWRSPQVALSWLDRFEKEELVAKLKTEEVRKKIREVHRVRRLKLGMIQTKLDPYWIDRFEILTCADKNYECKSVSKIAKMMSVDTLDAPFLLQEVDPCTVWLYYLEERYFEAALPVYFTHPNASPNTDWTCAPASPPEGFYYGKDMLATVSSIAYALFAD
jgi:N-acyl-D-aspartate/D-glutamate deacylase